MFFSSKKEEFPPQVDITTFEYIDSDKKYIFTDTILNNEYSIENIISDTKEESTEDVENNNQEEVSDDVEEVSEAELDSEPEEDTEDTIYVICIDDIPSLYKKTLQEAKDNIDQMAKLYNLNDFGYHNTLTNYKSEKEIEIIRNFDFGLFSLNFSMHTFKIFRLNN